MSKREVLALLNRIAQQELAPRKKRLGYHCRRCGGYHLDKSECPGKEER